MSLEDLLAPGSGSWWLMAAVVGFGRFCDLGSTFLATPRLLLEGNPVARRLGWRLGLPVNVLLVAGAACWPLLAVSLTTTSLLVAARNLQSAWLMRSMGEPAYRAWMGGRLALAPRGLARACFTGEALMFLLVGGALMWFARWQLIPFGIGLGIASHGMAVLVFTTLALWRLRDHGR
ncbi:MAG: hypothetical protein J0L84_10435 [Verrucomicrobia bacterium]|nr:hypothetical protein [Verrucomicrobiota bacterium]